MIVTGTIKELLEVQSGTSKADKEWQKQSIVIDTGSQYNPLVAINFFGEDKIKMIKNYKAGQEVEIAINISSHEYNGKYFHNIDGWKIVLKDGVKKLENAISDSPEDDDSGLPF